MTGWWRAGFARAAGRAGAASFDAGQHGLTHQLTLMAPPGASLPFDLAR
jgi:hypothetical protein